MPYAPCGGSPSEMDVYSLQGDFGVITRVYHLVATRTGQNSVAGMGRIVWSGLSTRFDDYERC